MESIEPVWLFGGITLVGGILLGVLLVRLFNPKTGDVEKLQAELDQARSEMETYKASVNTHFNKTSDLVNDLTQDYVKVYRHLAEGAQALSETREFTQVLDQPSGQVLISVEAEKEPATDALEAQADQPSVAAEADVPGEDNDASVTEPVTTVNDAADVPDTPVDYARANEDDVVTDETVAAEPESVEEPVKSDAENVAAESADEVTPSKDDTASAVETEQHAVADESETDSTKKT